MKTLFPLVVVLAFAGCAAPRARSAPASAATAYSQPIAPAVAPLLAKELELPCLGYALHARLVAAPGASPEERAKAEAEDYADAFEDAQHEKEYMECLEKDPASDDYRNHHADAARWLKDAEAARDRYAAARPAGRRIAAVRTTYSDVDARRGKAVVVVMLADGTSTSREIVFEKLR